MGEQNGMIGGVPSCCQVKKNEDGGGSGVRGEQVIGNFEEG